MQKVYLDNAATTRIRPEVLEYMHEGMELYYGNPSSTHSFGRAARARIEEARKRIAKTLHAHPSEIIFTSGGTEADNMALFGAVNDLGVKRIITSRIEHHAVLHTVEFLEKTCKIKVDFVMLDEGGNPSVEHLRELLEQGEEKTLVSLMHVNNEIGNRIDIHEVALLCKEYGALVHSDAVQSIGHWEWNLEKTPVDFLAASAHKFHGPKGVGFLYQRKDHQLTPLIHGGEQERGSRAGTESSHNILGLEKAFQLAYENLEAERNKITELKTYFIESLQKAVPGAAINGYALDAQKSTYTLVNVRLPIPPAKADMLLFQLDLKGVACSRGSACQSGSQSGSHVLREVLDDEKFAQPSLRFSFSVYTTREEIDYVMEVLKEYAG
ncbi:cysteine desulfurase [Robertkochia marina]|uniref:cysteine desulfurase n=1 Tax=Robertkochia marina TaxID=1227945 RepID=A0A4S3LY74_9FLAO|nr:cysteine desulfurase family protein [Robertkochia marina]THD66528.1 cysteine desulfurase [Robertkochia marina]TRZ45630.1 cysteine desulfurase [Robertkochia marina]